MLAEQSTHSSMNSGSRTFRQIIIIREWELLNLETSISIAEESAKNISEEKKQREQLLALNQVIAQQVIEKRKSLPG